MDWHSFFPPERGYLLTAANKHTVFFGFASLVGLATLYFISRCLNRSWIRLLTYAVPLAVVTSLARLMLIGKDEAYLIVPHFEVVFYPVVQSFLGKALYLNQSSQYGLYPIFLDPVWAAIGGLTIRAYSITMATLFAFSFTVLCCFVVRFSRNKMLGAIFAVLSVLTALLTYPFWPGDAYYAMFPIRQVFPAIAMALLALRTSGRRDLAAYAGLGLGLAWNLESGMIALAIYGAFCAAMAPAHSEGVVHELGRQALSALAGVGLAVAAVLLWFLIRYRAMPDLEGAGALYAAFSAGLMALPMPRYGFWVVHGIVYTLSIFYAWRTIGDRSNAEEARCAAALFAMAIGGLLWFRYYQGRSHPLVLTWVSAPMVCCVGLLVDRALAAMRPTPRVSALIPAALGAPMLAALGVWLWTNPVPQRPLDAVLGTPPDTLMPRLAREAADLFRSARTKPDDQLLAVTPFAALIDLDLGRPDPIGTVAGMCQIWFNRDIDQITAVASEPKTRMVILSENSPACPEIDMKKMPQELQNVLQTDYKILETPTDMIIDGYVHPYFYVRNQSR